MEERILPTYPLWEWQRVVSHVVLTLSMRDRRTVFQLARGMRVDEEDLANIFFPELGITLAEFAVYPVLARRR